MSIPYRIVVAILDSAKGRERVEYHPVVTITNLYLTSGQYQVVAAGAMQQNAASRRGGPGFAASSYLQLTVSRASAELGTHRRNVFGGSPTMDSKFYAAVDVDR
jgi:hypothetical protein